VVVGLDRLAKDLFDGLPERNETLLSESNERARPTFQLEDEAVILPQKRDSCALL
jgi:hypothetical protein